MIGRGLGLAAVAALALGMAGSNGSNGHVRTAPPQPQKMAKPTSNRQKALQEKARRRYARMEKSS